MDIPVKVLGLVATLFSLNNPDKVSHTPVEFNQVLVPLDNPFFTPKLWSALSESFVAKVLLKK